MIGHRCNQCGSVQRSSTNTALESPCGQPMEVIGEMPTRPARARVCPHLAPAETQGIPAGLQVSDEIRSVYDALSTPPRSPAGGSIIALHNSSGHTPAWQRSPEPPEEYTVQTVSARTGIPERTLQDWCFKGQIDHRRGKPRGNLGGRVRILIPEHELERLVGGAGGS